MAAIRRIGMIALVLGCLLPACSITAQTTSDPQWVPPASSVGIGIHRFAGDGESSDRIGLSWYWSQNRRLLITSRFWDYYDVFEAEVGWLRESRSSLRPMFTISGIWQEQGVQQSVGGAIGGGVEYYALDWAVVHATLAWQSLFAEEPYTDNHWFRVNLGVSLVPFG